MSQTKLKVCNTCGKELSLLEFHIRDSKANSRKYQCKKCTSIEQGGRCAICGKHQEEFRLRLSIDHCHKTGKIRGLLCHRCNGGLGCFEDNIELLRNTIKYLEQDK